MLSGATGHHLTGTHPPARLTTWTTNAVKGDAILAEYRWGAFSRVAAMFVVVALASSVFMVGAASPSASSEPVGPRSAAISASSWKRCQDGKPLVWKFSVKNVGCAGAYRVSRRAFKKYCRRINCPVPLESYRKGHVIVNGWHCKVTVYSEGDTERCRKGKRRLYRTYGA